MLEKAAGDLDKAEKLFVDERIQLIIDKTGIDNDTAKHLLIENNFDIAKTLQKIKEDRYTTTQLIIQKFTHNKEETLAKIATSVEENLKIERKFWLNFKELEKLTKESFCLLTIMEWLAFEDYESWDNALSFELDLVTQQIEQNLNCIDLVASLRKAKEIQNLVYQKNETHKRISNYIKASKELHTNSDYLDCEKFFKEQRPLLIDQLYDFVLQNIDKFP